MCKPAPAREDVQPEENRQSQAPVVGVDRLDRGMVPPLSDGVPPDLGRVGPRGGRRGSPNRNAAGDGPEGHIAVFGVEGPNGRGAGTANHTVSSRSTATPKAYSLVRSKEKKTVFPSRSSCLRDLLPAVDQIHPFLRAVPRTSHSVIRALVFRWNGAMGGGRSGFSGRMVWVALTISGPNYRRSSRTTALAGSIRGRMTAIRVGAGSPTLPPTARRTSGLPGPARWERGQDPRARSRVR